MARFQPKGRKQSLLQESCLIASKIDQDLTGITGNEFRDHRSMGTGCKWQFWFLLATFWLERNDREIAILFQPEGRK